MLALLQSCTNNHVEYFNPKKVDSLIWGNYAGMAYPHFSLVFKYSQQKLFVDTSDAFYHKGASRDPSKFIWVNLPKPDTMKIHQLIRLIPSEFFSKDTTFGHPDNCDQGGTFVIVYQEGKMTKYDIDNFKKQVPENIAPLSHRINELDGDFSEKYKVK